MYSVSFYKKDSSGGTKVQKLQLDILENKSALSIFSYCNKNNRGPRFLLCEILYGLNYIYRRSSIHKEQRERNQWCNFYGIICFHGSFRSILWSLKSFLFNGSSWSSNTFSSFVSQVKGYNNWQTTRGTISSSPECITAVFVQQIVAAFVVDTNKEIYNAWSPFPFQLIECLSWPGLVMGLWYFGVRSRLHSKCD